MPFFRNVTVPKTLLDATPSENWLVRLNNTDITAKSIITENAYTSVYFTYVLGNYEVRIRVVKVSVVNLIPLCRRMRSCNRSDSLNDVCNVKEEKEEWGGIVSLGGIHWQFLTL